MGNADQLQGAGALTKLARLAGCAALPLREAPAAACFVGQAVHDAPMDGSQSPKTEAFDVLIIGAGLSGIGAGYHLTHRCPGKSYVILERRDAARPPPRSGEEGA